jgi:hypothetical protein
MCSSRIGVGAGGRLFRNVLCGGSGHCRGRGRTTIFVKGSNLSLFSELKQT